MKKNLLQGGLLLTMFAFANLAEANIPVQAVSNIDARLNAELASSSLGATIEAMNTVPNFGVRAAMLDQIFNGDFRRDRLFPVAVKQMQAFLLDTAQNGDPLSVFILTKMYAPYLHKPPLQGFDSIAEKNSTKKQLLKILRERESSSGPTDRAAFAHVIQRIQALQVNPQTVVDTFEYTAKMDEAQRIIGRFFDTVFTALHLTAHTGSEAGKRIISSTCGVLGSAAQGLLVALGNDASKVKNNPKLALALAHAQDALATTGNNIADGWTKFRNRISGKKGGPVSSQWDDASNTDYGAALPRQQRDIPASIPRQPSNQDPAQNLGAGFGDGSRSGQGNQPLDDQSIAKLFGEN